MSVTTFKNTMDATLIPSSSTFDAVDLLHTKKVNAHKHAADALATTATAEQPIDYISNISRLSLIKLMCQANVTANDTNYATFNFYKRDGAGGSSVLLATLSTTVTGGSGNITAFVPVTIPLGANSLDAIAAGSVLTWEIVKVNAGVVVPIIYIEIEYMYL